MKYDKVPFIPYFKEANKSHENDFYIFFVNIKALF